MNSLTGNLVTESDELVTWILGLNDLIRPIAEQIKGRPNTVSYFKPRCVQPGRLPQLPKFQLFSKSSFVLMTFLSSPRAYPNHLKVYEAAICLCLAY